jgi:hypothetical protein
LAQPGLAGLNFPNLESQYTMLEKSFQALIGTGFKSNYFDVETGEHYWISGCRKDGRDALYSTVAEIDEDVREEYWSEIRGMPENLDVSSIKVRSKY